jgi:inner membrane protein
MALALLAAYVGAHWFLHERALAVLDSRIYQGATARRVAAFPHFADPWRWTGLVETDNAYVLFDLNLRADRFDPAGGRTFYKPEPSPAIDAARQTGPFRAFLQFSQYPLWSVVPLDPAVGALEVQALDLRFGVPGDGRVAATAILDGNNRVLRSWFQYQPPGAFPTIR